MRAIACISYGNSVCPSVCPSQPTTSLVSLVFLDKISCHLVKGVDVPDWQKSMLSKVEKWSDLYIVFVSRSESSGSLVVMGEFGQVLWLFFRQQSWGTLSVYTDSGPLNMNQWIVLGLSYCCLVFQLCHSFSRCVKLAILRSQSSTFW